MTGTDGVRINCHGDIHISGRPDFEPWPFEDEHFVPSQIWVDIPIAEKLRFPLIIHGLEPGLSWRGRCIVADNSKTLYTEELNSNFQSLNPALWRAIASTVAVARKDRKPLHVAHVYALQLYCVVLGDRWGGIFPTSDGGDPLHGIGPEVDPLFRAQAEFIVKMANKEEFLVLWNDYMLHSGKDKYGDVASPYDI